MKQQAPERRTGGTSLCAPKALVCMRLVCMSCSPAFSHAAIIVAGYRTGNELSYRGIGTAGPGRHPGAESDHQLDWGSHVVQLHPGADPCE